jgi:hypothetical protein
MLPNFENYRDSIELHLGYMERATAALSTINDYVVEVEGLMAILTGFDLA